MRSHSFVALAVLSITSVASAATYDVDPNHSSAGFSVRHLAVAQVHGEFGNVAGKVNLDEKDITKSTVEASVDATSVSTRNERRDGHLKSPDFFDVAKYPQLTFKSTKVEKVSATHLKVTGDLTIRGTSKPTVLEVEITEKDVKDLAGNWVRAISASTKVNRKEYGLTWNKALEGGGVLVGDEVAITIDAELTRKGEGKSMSGSK